MAEVKNSFIKSKMNKDLDDRLLPSGEYRDAQNVQVSRSQSSDVGALENIFGTKSIKDFATENDVPSDVKCIGYVTNETQDLVFTFWTDYYETTSSYRYLNSAKNFIFSYNVLSDTTVELVSGSFLNFSQRSPIIGVSVLEELLFWTDNRNQPRVINWYIATQQKALGQDYYVNEDQISVATYNPYEAITVVGASQQTAAQLATADVDGAITNSKDLVVDNVTGTITVGLGVYYTTVNGTNTKTGTWVTAVAGNDITLNQPNTIADGVGLTFAGLETKMKDVSNQLLPDIGGKAFVDEGSTTWPTNTFDIDNIVPTSFTPSNGDVLQGSGIPVGTTVTSYTPAAAPGDPNVLVISQSVTLSDNSTIRFGVANPYYEVDYSGDPLFLEDKFVRFSYRFLFDNGQYSLIAPWSQIMYIPKQDGYFTHSTYNDQKSAVDSTVVEFMENKVTKIDLQVPLPATGTELSTLVTSPIKIVEIDILYKESDARAVQVVDTVVVDNTISQAFENAVGTDDTWVYTYNSTKPFKTLPNKDIVRVYDKIPVRAFGQEIISNRVVYSNYQDKHTPPPALNYQIAISDKYPVTQGDVSNLGIVEYPNSSVKQNRNYQVGVVLCDKYGRSSTTLLSSNTDSQTPTGFGASTVYSPYRSVGDGASDPWPGNSIKFQLVENIQSAFNLRTGTPGLYNGDSTSEDYNPLGWYSYKIVVKQTEQDYYNVYLPGILEGSATNTSEITSHTILINDNINKIPRDLSEVGPDQKQFRSSVQLFARVENLTITSGGSAAVNKQFYPGSNSDTVSSIQDLREMFDVTVNPTSQDPIVLPDNTLPINVFFKGESNPLAAKITTTQSIGVPNVSTDPYENMDAMAVYETEPVESRLDIYWETSSAGLISELNELNNNSAGAQFIPGYVITQDEGQGLDEYVTNEWYPTDFIGQQIYNYTAEIITVVDNTGSGTNRKDQWILESNGGAGTAVDPIKYRVKTSTVNGTKSTTPVGGYQYYGPNAINNEAYTFTIKITDNTDPLNPVETEIIKSGTLDNIAPSITEIDGVSTTCPASVQQVSGVSGTLFTISAINGANVGGTNTANSTKDIVWSIQAQTQGGVTVNEFEIASNSTTGIGTVTQKALTGNTLAGQYNIKIRATDAGGLNDECEITLTVGASPVSAPFSFNQNMLADGDGVMLYYTGTQSTSTPTYTNLDGGSAFANQFNNGNASQLAQQTPQSPNEKWIFNDYCTAPPYSQYTWQGVMGNGSNAFGKLEEGAFYVQLTVTCNVQATLAQLYGRFCVEYRSSNTADWALATDLNDEDCLATGLFRLADNSPQDGTPGSWSAATGSDAYSMFIENTTSTATSGRRVFACDTPGEYRITVAALSGVQGIGTNATANYPDCTSQAFNASQSLMQLNIGDFNYLQGISGSPITYEYKLGGGGVCGGSLGSTKYYAKEGITKYVTQLYSDSNATTTASISAGTYLIAPFNTPSGSTKGYEYTRLGSYQATFNASGLRTSTSMTPCFY